MDIDFVLWNVDAELDSGLVDLIVMLVCLSPLRRLYDTAFLKTLDSMPWHFPFHGS